MNIGLMTFPQAARRLVLAVGFAGFMPALALANGAVKVDCNDGCDDVTLGEICDTFLQDAEPLAVACENVANPGRGTLENCGNGGAGVTCRPTNGLDRSDKLGSYCFGNGDGPDAVVTCSE